MLIRWVLTAVEAMGATAYALLPIEGGHYRAWTVLFGLWLIGVATVVLHMCYVWIDDDATKASLSRRVILLIQIIVAAATIIVSICVIKNRVAPITIIP